MTDAIKMAEMQRANIEFERQRHLANWLIKSSAHMAKPSSQQQQQILTASVSQQKLNLSSLNSNNKNASISIKNGTITQNPIFFMGGVSGGGGGLPGGGNGGGGGGIVNGSGNVVGQKSSLTKPTIFTSQTNLPLQIVTQSPDGHKPKLRRFNSHDTSANMFSVVDFENARLARRNEIERQKYKMNSLSSGGDCSTGDSKGSKFSNDSNPEPLPANVFLERYSLPRVIRLKYNDKFNTLLSSSSNDSGLSTDKKNDINCKNGDINGELFLLYRHLKNRKIYHGYNTKTGANKKKGVKIPQEYQGYFSLVNERGHPTATLYTTIIQLVRERVYKFVTVENMPAYTEQQTDTFPTKSHYVKGTAKAGQIFRLLAVFQDGGINSNHHGGSGGHHHHSHHDSSSNSLASQKDGGIINSTGRDKERGRYAQLLGENRQIVYVSLSVKGKFYEIEQSVPQILQRSSSLGKPSVPKKLNNECIHHISNVITSETEFPINLKFISGPSGCGHPIPENLTIHHVSTENSLIVCPIEETESRSPLYLRKLQIQSDMILTKCYLGFENEQRMFTNQNVQNLLKFCQYNSDNFQRLIEIEHINSNSNHSNGHHHHEHGLKILRPLNFTKFLNRDKIGHEKEDSIIFLSKNDLDNLEIHQQQKQLRKEEENEIESTHVLDSSRNNINNNHNSNSSSNSNNENQTISDKMKVFQTNSSKKKWFKNFNNKNSTTNSNRIQASSFTSLDDFMDLETKRRSMDRYQDMSRLLQERFGGNIEFDSINHDMLTTASSMKDDSSRPSSDIGINPPEISNLTKKSMSLQDVVDRQLSVSRSSHAIVKHEPLPETPDLLKIERALSTNNTIDHDGSESEFISITNYQQSFISEKLYNEFHVKTKHHSKSSSNLHQLLHFAVPQKMSVNDLSKKKLGKSKTVTIQSPALQSHTSTAKPMPISAAASQPILNIEDDLPYSNVRDSLLIGDHQSSKAVKQTSNGHRHSADSDQSNVDRLAEIQNENIYAEICNDTSSVSSNSHDIITRAQTERSIVMAPAAGESIRISISTSPHDNHAVDNIYNTIK